LFADTFVAAAVALGVVVAVVAVVAVGAEAAVDAAVAVGDGLASAALPPQATTAAAASIRSGRARSLMTLGEHGARQAA
jgi:hypothetical protein